MKPFYTSPTGKLYMVNTFNEETTFVKSHALKSISFRFTIPISNDKILLKDAFTIIKRSSGRAGDIMKKITSDFGLSSVDDIPLYLVDVECPEDIFENIGLLIKIPNSEYLIPLMGHLEVVS